MTETTAREDSEQGRAVDRPLREVRYEYSREFLPILEQVQASLFVSTYQAGKLVVVGMHDGAIALSFHNFEQAMGVAIGTDRIAVGARSQIWFLHSAPEIVPRIQPAGRHDACYLARASHVTGEIHGHEIAWGGNQLWVVNTLFSCLCTLDGRHSFVPQWRPSFISSLAAEDRCHLNGLAMQDGRPRYVTAMSRTDTAAGWRAVKATDGCMIDVPGGQIVAQGFAMPHSPRLHDGRVWLLDSGRGRLVTVDADSGKSIVVDEVPGYTRGLAFCGPFAFVGLSRIRETSTFGGIPIAGRRDELRCGVAVVDLRSGRSVAYLEFKSGVEEIFDVQVLPSVRCAAVSGPFATVDGAGPIWLVPG